MTDIVKLTRHKFRIKCGLAVAILGGCLLAAALSNAGELFDFRSRMHLCERRNAFIALCIGVLMVTSGFGICLESKADNLMDNS